MEENMCNLDVLGNHLLSETKQELANNFGGNDMKEENPTMKYSDATMKESS